MLEAEVAEPGHSADSSIIERVTSDDPEYRMPLEAPPLSAEEIDVLRRWIDAGLPWQEGFSFREDTYEPPLKPRRPELPAATAASENPIDRIVLAYWQEHGIEPPPPLDDAAFYRRASLDLVGLLPTPAEVEAFQADGDPDKRAAAGATTARRSRRLCRPLADVLERLVAQRLRGHGLHRRRPQADHRLALSLAAGQQAVRPVRARVGGTRRRSRQVLPTASSGAAR